MATLEYLVDKYTKLHRQVDADWMAFLRSKSYNMVVLITLAVWGKEEFRKRDFHQRWVDEEVLDEVAERLAEKQDELLACTSFDELYHVIEQSALPGFRDVCIYDTAFRIGCALPTPLFPDKVYLHAGAKIGARRLLGAPVVEGKRFIDKLSFPGVMQVLEPYEIENFLCRNKDRFD